MESRILFPLVAVGREVQEQSLTRDWQQNHICRSFWVHILNTCIASWRDDCAARIGETSDYSLYQSSPWSNGITKEVLLLSRKRNNSVPVSKIFILMSIHYLQEHILWCLQVLTYFVRLSWEMWEVSECCLLQLDPCYSLFLLVVAPLPLDVSLIAWVNEEVFSRALSLRWQLKWQYCWNICPLCCSSFSLPRVCGWQVCCSQVQLWGSTSVEQSRKKKRCNKPQICSPEGTLGWAGGAAELLVEEEDTSRKRQGNAKQVTD